MKVTFTLFDGITDRLVARTIVAEIIEGSERQQHSQIDRCVCITESWLHTNSVNSEHQSVEINTEELPELIRALQFLHTELKLYEDSLL